MSYQALLTSIGNFSLAVDNAIKVRVAPNSLKLQNQTLAEILATAAIDAGQQVDQLTDALIAEYEQSILELGGQNGGDYYRAVTEAHLALTDAVITADKANHFSKTIIANTVFTVSGVAAVGRVTTFILNLTNGGAHTVQWWSNINWAGGVAPALTAAGRDVIAFTSRDGGASWDGYLLGTDMKAAA